MNRRVLYLGLLFFTALCSAFALVKQEERIIQDSQLTRGKLNNGLEYYILPNQLPTDRVELRLIVEAGSTQEREDQRGLAHFLEHMAFNGTSDFPKNELVEYLQSLGMEFGPEINAYTSFDETVYKLSLPSDPQSLEEGLKVLQQWAFHISLEEDDIQAERPVVLEEWRAGRNAMMRMQEKAYPEIYRDSVYGQRLPIGTKESLETFQTDSLRDFYRDWYRPELMDIVVVGDVDSQEVDSLIKEYFSPYQNHPDQPERIKSTIPDHQEDIYTLQRDAETTYGAINVMKMLPEYSLDTRSAYRSYIIEQLNLMMFNTRLATVLREAESPFIDGYASINGKMDDKDVLSFSMISGPENLPEGFRAFWREKLRMERFGLSGQ
jgi:zinc protease